jgi:hypothetical protein
MSSLKSFNYITYIQNLDFELVVIIIDLTGLLLDQLYKTYYPIFLDISL